MAQQKSKIDNTPISQNISWNIINSYFRDNPYNLVAHHLDSYNAFIETGIQRVFRENNPIRFIEEQQTGKKKRKQCFLYMGGKNADKIYFENPILPGKAKNAESGIGEDTPENLLYPNYARLNNLTYGVNVFYDVDIEYLYYAENDKEIKYTSNVERIKLGTIPIMLHSNICILRNMPREARYNMGECRNDTGGYFIINGKEKVVVCQERFADNMIYTKKHPNNQQHIDYSYSCEIRCVSEDSSKPIRYTSVRISRFNPIKKSSDSDDEDSDEGSKETNQELNDLIGKIVVDVPNIKRPVPLFILMRALGVISDKEIIRMCVWDLDNTDMVNALLPSITDNNHIYTQTIALEYLTSFTKYQTSKSYLMNVLMNFFLPHIGEDNYYTKARFIGYMVNRILRVSMGKDHATDRDNYTFKRVETSGSMLYDVFREYYLLQKTNIGTQINKIYNGNFTTYGNNEHFTELVHNNTADIFKENIVHDGLKKAFMGSWGASPETKRVGVIQDLLILSWFSKTSHIRKINLGGNPVAKIVAPHLLHNSQWGIIDPVDTPDGGNVGFHKHMAISAAISLHSSPKLLIEWLIKDPVIEFISFEQSSDSQIANLTKLFVNGNWIGMTPHPINTLIWTRLCRRNGLLPNKCSISFDFSNNTLYYYTDSGRLTRPIFYCVNGKPSYEMLYSNANIDKNTISDKISEMKWDSLVAGFGEKDIHDLNSVHNIEDLYPSLKNNSLAEIRIFLTKNAGIIEYIDTAEEGGTLISMNSAQLTHIDQNKKDKEQDELSELKKYTHLEIDPSLIFGILGNSVIFPEHNQFPRNLFSCGQSKQASSVYNSNFTRRFDTSVVVLNNGQTPLIKSRYLKYMNNEEHPYGVNTIVAIMSLTGYNVEDAILANAGSVQRGLFRTTYLKTYVVRESSETVEDSTINSIISNIGDREQPEKLKPNYDYSQLDSNGLVREGTAIHEKLILAGKSTSSSEDPDNWTDSSVGAKKGQGGYVDKVYVTSAPDGFRTGKIRIRDERTPAIGDKMASRAGQKGTLGIIIPEENMPFTADGIRPDLIINPHAIPSRMTIGQLIECLFGKVCAEYGTYGDCTAFANKGSGYDVYSKILPKMGFHGSGTQVLYDGITGTQLNANIFIGPTYYMRLKHMVADKINYRAKGPVNVLTRQSVHGRANDGGLRIGEMERDSIIAHGACQFLNDSFLTRGDEYLLAVCNHTGSIAIYNPKKDIYLSPFIDGPLMFHMSEEDIYKSYVDMKSIHGRSFSIVRVPYAFKLLIHELQVMNVQMRIVTEDNIDQMMNLSYQSNNIDKLLHLSDSTDLKETLEEYAKEMANKIKTNSNTLLSYKKHIYGDGEKCMSNKLISKRAFLFNDLDKNKVKDIQMDTVAGFSVTDAHAANKMTELLLQHVGDNTDLTILDGMACVGGNTRSFAAAPNNGEYSIFKRGFSNVIANELDPDRKQMLEHNIKTVYKRKNVKFYSQDIRSLINELAGQYDVLFLDPEWGGTDYKKVKSMRLSIEDTPIEHVVVHAFSISPQLKATGVKLPLNYDHEFFIQTMDKAELDVNMYATNHFTNMSMAVVTRKDSSTKKSTIGGDSTGVIVNRSDLPVFARKSDPKIFDDDELNDMFSHLSAENQASIIQPHLSPTDREVLMKRLYASIEDGRTPIPPTPIYTSEFKNTSDTDLNNPKLDILNIEKSHPEQDTDSSSSSSSSNTNSSSSDGVKKMTITPS